MNPETLLYFVAPRQKLELSQTQVLTEICHVTLQAYQETEDQSIFKEWEKQSYGKVVLQAKNHLQSQELSQLFPSSEHNFIAIPPVNKQERPEQLNKMNLLTSFRLNNETDILTATVDNISFEKKKFHYICFINQSLNMKQGKTAAQCAHAYLEIVRKYQPELLHYQSTRKPSVGFLNCDQTQWEEIILSENTLIITDQGRTEIEPGSQTVCAIKTCNL